ncbi:transposase [Streptomyces sp. NBC_01386]|uniref:integrase core domain-containing protein n=1 Tax=Streptomyces sp. NBC_01386 TaxID=2903848 RepID=UPI0032460AF3
MLLSAPRAPRMNAHCERVIGTIRREARDRVLILGESHARKVLTDYQDHYNGRRPHRSRQQLPPSATEQPAIMHDLDDRSLLRTRVLGGIINEYLSQTCCRRGCRIMALHPHLFVDCAGHGRRPEAPGPESRRIW